MGWTFTESEGVNHAIRFFALPDKSGLTTHTLKAEQTKDLDARPLVSHPIFIKGTWFSGCADEVPGAVVNIFVESALDAVTAVRVARFSW